MTTFYAKGMAEPIFLLHSCRYTTTLHVDNNFIKWNNGLVIRALDSQSKGGIFINIKQLYRHFSLNLQRMNIQRSVK